ncbi:MAG: hypothetical protein COA83_03425 [Methylophaga sp.]|nr:MAG: hypothetical protein COA83_03425 [Methylophaga sp.]
MKHDDIYNLSKRFSPPKVDLRKAQILDDYGDDSFAKMPVKHNSPDDVRREEFDYYGWVYPFVEAEDRTWYILINSLAAASLTEQSYAQYMCKDKKPCANFNPKDQSRTPIGTWGGRQSNQFESRRAFASFMDKELDKYLAWAKQLSYKINCLIFHFKFTILLA